MNKQNSYKNFATHHSWKSNLASDIIDYRLNENPKLFKTQTKKVLRKSDICMYKTEDNREVNFKDSVENSASKRSFSKASEDPKSVKKTPESQKSALIKNGQDKSTKKFIKDQDEIIIVQNALIEDLKGEIKKLQSKRQKLGIIDESLSGNEGNLHSENLKLSKKIEHLKKEHEVELGKIKRGIDRKNMIFDEYKMGLEMRLEKKKLKIKALKGKVKESTKECLGFYDNTCKKGLVNLKEMLDKETKLRLDFEEELFLSREKEKTLTEENNMLVQNYEEVQKKFNQVEIILIKINDSLSSNFRKHQSETFRISDFAENLESLIGQYEIYEKRSRSLTEKNLNLELDNQSLKSQLGKVIEEKQETGRRPVIGDFEKVSEKLAKKEEKVKEYKWKIEDLKKKVSFLKEQNSKLNYEVKNNGKNSFNESVTEGKISLMEEELNLLKTENRILIGKEQDLTNRLKSSEKARYHYQELTISLKERVNSLETQLKYMESSLSDLQIHEIPFSTGKSKPRKSTTAQPAKHLAKDHKKHPS